MKQRHRLTCPVAGFLNVFGDAWTLLLIREAFYGSRRFSDFQANTGIAKNILSMRLDLLVREDILEKHDVGERGTRFEYRLTERGRSLLPVFIAVTQWGNEHVYGAGREPVTLHERSSGEALSSLVPIGSDGNALDLGDIVVRPGPGASPATRRRIAAIAPP